MFAAINAFLTRAVSGYFLNKSLRFRSSASAYLNRTPATTTNQKTWTWSGWVKRGILGSSTQELFTGTSSGNFTGVRFIADQLYVQDYLNGSYNIYWVTNAVYRDPAAWYHVVVNFDTTQASSANAVSIWINGALQTATFQTALGGYVQNRNGYINTGSLVHYVSNGVSSAYFDGEMAEVNFVDGQALAPTSFGAYSIYNQWLPIRYAGAYGTNGFYLPFSATSATSYAGYFDGTTNWLSTPQSSNFTFDANFTIEFWVYITANQNAEFVATANNSAYLGSGNSGWIVAYYTGGGGIRFSYQSSNSWVFETILGITPSLNSWNHVAIVRNGSAITGYLNGVAGSSPGTSSATLTSNLYGAYIGSGAGNQSFKLGGYISNVRIVKGTAVYTANFVPPTAALTAISGTQLLTLQNATIVDNSTNAFTITNTGTVVTSVQSPFLNPTVLTADSSGNANNWTPNNISLTAGSTYDSLTDVPTLTSTTVANYAVLNPLSASASPKPSDGNLTIAFGGTYPANVLGSIGVSTGKWYWEVGFAGGNYTNGHACGVAVSGWANNNVDPGSVATPYSHYVDSRGYFVNNSAQTSNSINFGAGDIIGIALNCDTNVISFYKNNTLIGTAQSIESGQTWFSLHKNSSYTALTQYANYGQQPFVYTAPSGFLPLNTYNI